jgi:hypothetical protein
MVSYEGLPLNSFVFKIVGNTSAGEPRIAALNQLHSALNIGGGLGALVLDIIPPYYLGMEETEN